MFQKATRKKVKLKIAITGPSGSGKSYSALRLATGLGGKIAFLDTENSSGSLYSDKFDFDAMDMHPPYLVTKYIEGINGAVSGGYDTLIIDSLSHAWAGEGGILHRKNDFDLQGKGNSYTNWQKFTKEQDLLNSKILNSPINIIVTMRSKQDYSLVEDEKGKMRPQKLGLAPIQRDGMEYEFTTVFDIQMSHRAESSKDRTGLFTDQIFQVTEDTGKILKEWVQSAKQEEVTPENNKQVFIELAETMIKDLPETKQLAAHEALKSCENIDEIKAVIKRIELTLATL